MMLTDLKEPSFRKSANSAAVPVSAEGVGRIDLQIRLRAADLNTNPPYTSLTVE